MGEDVALLSCLYSEEVKPVLGLATALLLAGSLEFTIDTPKGLTFRHENSPTRQKYLPETMGGGVAVLDYNKDGLLDIFFVNSGYLGPVAAEQGDFRRNLPKYWNRLYRQNPDHSFTDVTAAAGLDRAGNSNYGMGVAAADYDNDGFTDLYVTSFGHNVLYRNNGNGTFTDVTHKAGVAGGGWSASTGFFDFDNDGKLDLFVTRYMDWDFQRSKICARDTYCPPGDFPQTTNLLFHNRGDGTFQDVSEGSGISANKGRSLGVAFNDYDGDGLPDIFVANDGMEQFLFHNDGSGRFSERALDLGVALSDDGKPFSGMGVDFRDYDNDGRPDIVVTDLAKQVYAVYHNDGKNGFTYASQATGLAQLSGGSSGWGVRWEDLDNDGWKDLFVAQSHVMDNIEQMDGNLHFRERPLVAMNHDGHFERAAPELGIPMAARGAAFADLYNDGQLEVVVTNLGGTPVVVRSRRTPNHWLTIALRGVRSNRDGIGAQVVVRPSSGGAQTQYVNPAGSYLSSSDVRAHFGLGTATMATVEVQWPSGRHQQLRDVRADQFFAITEPGDK